MLEDVKRNIEKLIALYEAERERARVLSESLQQSETLNETYRKRISELEGEIETLKLSQAFTFAEGSTPEAKDKIDKMIKEIDKCIALIKKS